LIALEPYRFEATVVQLQASLKSQVA
jgi:hypothetical protein